MMTLKKALRLILVGLLLAGAATSATMVVTGCEAGAGVDIGDD